VNDADALFTNPDGPLRIEVSGGIVGGGPARRTVTLPIRMQFRATENRWSWLFTSKHTNTA
jgi:hypothetical protein